MAVSVGSSLGISTRVVVGIDEAIGTCDCAGIASVVTISPGIG